MNPICLDIPEQFATERMILRAPMYGDGAIVNEAIKESFQTLNQWMNWAVHIPDIHETEENVRKNRAKFILRERFMFYMMDKATNQYIGTCSFVSVDWKSRKFEIGYWIRDRAAGKGYMTEAVKGMTDYADQHFQANRIEIRCDTNNIRSRKVAERCGYHLEAILLNHSVDSANRLRDDCIYTKIRLHNGTLGYPVA